MDLKAANKSPLAKSVSVEPNTIPEDAAVSPRNLGGGGWTTRKQYNSRRKSTDFSNFGDFRKPKVSLWVKNISRDTFFLKMRNNTFL